MAKSKAELQVETKRYYNTVARMHDAHKDGQYLKAIKVAVSACDVVDGMMQFESRYENRAERNGVECIDYLLKYAPILFCSDVLQMLAELLKSHKRIVKSIVKDLAEALNQADALMWDAHRLWAHLQQNNSTNEDRLRTDLGGNQNRWRDIAKQWESMGIVQRTPQGGSYQLSFFTQLTKVVPGKCPSCGATGKAAMGRFLEELCCPKCRSTVHFVYLLTESERAS